MKYIIKNRADKQKIRSVFALREQMNFFKIKVVLYGKQSYNINNATDFEKNDLSCISIT